jgi:hypothetical protein
MRAVLAVTGLALLAAGCASTETEPTPIEQVVVTYAAPTPMAGRDWHLSQYWDQSTLAYGVAESDDVNLVLTCADGAGEVSMFRDVANNAPREFHLEAGGDSGRFAADSEPSMLTDGQLLTAHARTNEPVFRSFRSLGWLASWTGEDREGYAPQPGSEGNIERFFAACG